MATTIIAWEPGSAVFPTTNPAQLAAVQGTNFPWLSLNFDPTTAESVFFVGIMGQNYAEGNLSVRIWWTATATGNVKWNTQFLGLVNDEILDSALSAAATFTDGVTAANDIMEAPISLVAPALDAGDFLVLKIERDAANAADTCAVDAKLLLVEVRE